MALIAIAVATVAFETALTVYRLLRPKPGVPLRDLEVMTATNGAPIPFGYGTCRVAGNVIWTSGVTYTTLGKKKNQGQALGPKGSFLFHASLAVAFGEGPGIITRIWADTKLIYNAAGTSPDIDPADYPEWSASQLYNPGNQVQYGAQVWQALAINTNSAPSQTNTNWIIISSYPPWSNTTEYVPGDIVSFNGTLYLAQLQSNDGTTGAIAPDSGAFQNIGHEDVLYWIPLTALYPAPTIYPGNETQLADSMISASETAALTPAFRGLIYAVWENFPLTNFADRIPSFRAEITYTKTTNLLSNTGVAAQDLSAGFGFFGGITTQVLQVNAGDTIIALFGNPAGASNGGAGSPPSISDTQGNTYATAQSSGPAGTEYSSVQIIYTNANATGADTITAFGSGIRIIVLPGTWAPDFSGAWTDDVPRNPNLGSGATGFATNPGEYLVVAFAAAYSRPTSLLGDLPPIEPPEVLISLDTPVGSASGETPAFLTSAGPLGPAYPSPAPGFGISDHWVTWYFDNLGDGGAGVWATFRPTSSPATPPPPATKPDVLHDICERTGLTPAQIDNTLCGPANIFTPQTPTNKVSGYLVDRMTPASEIIRVLMHAFFFDVCETNGTMKFVPRGLPSALTIPEADLGLETDKYKLIESIAQEQDLPENFTVTYADPILDFQQNKQSKTRSSRIVKSKNQVILEVPMTMTSDWARQTAEKALYLAWLERSNYKLNLWKASYLLLDPTDVIAFIYESLSFQVRLAETHIGADLKVALDGLSEYVQMFNSAATGGGPAFVQTPAPQVLIPTILFLFDIPLLRDVDSNFPNTGFYFAMGSPSPTWPGGILAVSTDDANFTPQATDGRDVTYGFATNALAAPPVRGIGGRSPWIWDNTSTLNVMLQNGTFAGDTQVNVLNGSNGLIVGQEIIQFATAVHNSDGSWTLSGLLRGRRGTEWAIGTHTTGELVVMPSTGIQHVADPLSVISQQRWYIGVTNGQDPSTVASQEFTIAGRDLMPYAPVHIAGARDGSNDLTISWVRRTRIGWLNLAQDPVPLSEDSEAYSIDVLNGSTVVRTLTSTSPSVAYSAAEQTADFGSPQSSVSANVYQLSQEVGRGFAGVASV